MFNEEGYLKFVENKIEWVGTAHNSITKNEILSGLSQFNEPIFRYIKRTQAATSTCLSKVFYTTLKNKISSVRINDYLLYLYGYKYCKHCEQVLSFEYFCADKGRWDNMSLKCKECYNAYRNGNYQEHYKQYAKDYRKNNSEKVKDYGKKYREQNREEIRERKSKYQKENPHKNAAKSKKYSTSKLHRTPKWLTKTHLIEIEDMYWCSMESERILGYKHHVDHVVPLQGKYVSGLHVPWNLQILTQTENTQKSNYHESEEEWTNHF